MAKTAKKTSKTSKKSSTKVTEEVVVVEKPVKVNTEPTNKKRLWVTIGVIVLGGLVLFLVYKWMVVAWVDRMMITRFDLYSRMESRFGKNMTEEMIVEKLIKSEAAKRGVVVTNADVKADIKKLEDQNGGPEQFEQALAMQGMTREGLEEETMYRLLITKMFGDSVTVSDAEVDQYLESRKDEFKEITDDIKNQVREELKNQKLVQAFSAWIEENSKGTRVVRYTN